VYAVRADGAPLDPVLASEADAGTAHRIAHRERNDGVHYSLCPFDSARWAPATERVASAGSLPAASGTNRGLTGTLYLSVSEYANSVFSYPTIAVDLSSGSATRLPTPITEAIASPDRSEFINVTTGEDAEGHATAKVSSYRPDGSVAQSFALAGTRHGAIRRSPDGLHLALTLWRANGLGVVVTDRRGAIQFELDGVDAVDWSRDGRLVIARADGLALVDPGAGSVPAATVTILRLADPVSYLRVSPDGDSLALAMMSRLWTVKLDGTRLEQLTQSGGLQTKPEWSPDGRFIAFQVSADASPTTLWVVASDARGVWVGDPARHTQAINLQALIAPNATTPQTINPAGDLSWR
jgi:hypothetical protein